MANRRAAVTVGVALLIIGLTGLGLVKSGVICPGGAVAPLGGDTLGGADTTQAAKQPEEVIKPSASGPGEAAGQSLPRSEAVKKSAPLASNPNGAHPYEKSSTPPAGTADHFARSGLLPQRPALKGHRGYVLPRAGAKHPVRGRFALFPTRPVVITFNFDPARSRSFDVAWLHLGDRVRISVQRVGQVGRRVYFTFSGNLDSRRGARLTLKTMYSFERPVYYRGAAGYYVVRIRIYPDNRWRIRPRSLV
ncbi:MAG: hypothetical protein ACP5IL_02555 [Syntrophobacteraceae bacterium]